MEIHHSKHHNGYTNGKAVEPIFLSKLPTGIKNINNIIERKKLFIKVILPNIFLKIIKF